MPACIMKLDGKMTKLFDGANRYILFIQVLALLVSVCFTSSFLQLSEKPPRLLRRSPPRRSSPEGKAVSTIQWERANKGPSVTLFVTGG